MEELVDFVLVGEAHYPLHPGTVVPGPVEQNDLARRRKMRHIALKIPLALFPLGRRGQGDDAATARVKALGDSFDHPALSGGIAAFEQNDQFVIGGLHPILQSDQFGLKAQEIVEIFAAIQGRMVAEFADGAEFLGNPQVVDFHLQFFVEAVLQFRFDPAFSLVLVHLAVHFRLLDSAPSIAVFRRAPC